ncbi:MAG: molybdopterin-guanine dinucleotide biosynthesis protein B [Halanaerobiaceae bacterium]
MKEAEIPMLAVIGWSDSGKTTFVSELITALKERGYNVVAIKYDAHRFQIDKPGKDSWRLRQAGADTVFISSDDKLAMIKSLSSQPTPEEMVATHLDGNCDLVVIEGYKHGPVPRVEIFRPDKYDEPVKRKEEVLERIINSGSRDELQDKARKLINRIEKDILRSDSR